MKSFEVRLEFSEAWLKPTEKGVQELKEGITVVLCVAESGIGLGKEIIIGGECGKPECENKEVTPGQAHQLGLWGGA